MSPEILAMVALRTTILLAFALAACLLTARKPALRRAVGRAALVGTVLLAGFTVWNPSLVRPTVTLPPLPRESTPEMEAPAPIVETKKPRQYEFTPPFYPAPQKSAPSLPREPKPEVVPTPERPSLGRIVAFVWAGGAGLLSLHLLLGYASLFRLRRRCRTVALDDVLDPICAELHIRKPVLVAGDEVTNPFVAGTIRPTVYLPARLLGTEELVPILRHEAAHLAGNDLRWSLLHRLALILLWPQPLLWLLKRPVEAASETLCDGQVLAGGVSARSYASCLLNLRETAAPRVPIGIGAVGNRSSFARRIEAILGGRIAIRLSTPVRVGVFGLTLVLAGSASLLAFGQEEVKPTLPSAAFGDRLKVSGTAIVLTSAEVLTPVSGVAEWRYKLLSDQPGRFDWKRSRAEAFVEGKWLAAKFDSFSGVVYGIAEADAGRTWPEAREITYPVEYGALPPDAIRVTLFATNRSEVKPVVLVFDRALQPKAKTKSDARRVKVRLLTPEGAPVEKAWATVQYDPYVMHYQDAMSFNWGGEPVPVRDGVAEVVLPKKVGTEKPMLIVRAPGCGLSILRIEAKKSEFELRMAKPIEVATRILNPDGSPAVGVRIVVQDIRFDNERTRGYRWSSGGDIPGQFSTPSDANGEIRIGGLPQGATVTFARLDERYAPLPASQIELPKHSQMRLSTLRLKRAATLQGYVRHKGKPVTGAFVYLDSPSELSGSYFLNSITDAKGAYVFRGLAPGECRLGFSPGGMNKDLVAPVLPKIKLSEGQRKTGLNFELQSGGVVSGRVSDAKGKPVAGVFISFQKGPSGSPNPAGYTGRDGRYRVRALPGVYRLTVDQNRDRRNLGTFKPRSIKVVEGKPVTANFRAK